MSLLLTTQPQAHFSQTNLQTTLSANPHPPFSFPIPEKLPSTSYDPYASLHRGFHDYPTSSFQPPILPPNPLPPSNFTCPFNPPSQPPHHVFPKTPSVPFAALSYTINV